MPGGSFNLWPELRNVEKSKHKINNLKEKPISTILVTSYCLFKIDTFLGRGRHILSIITSWIVQLDFLAPASCSPSNKRQPQLKCLLLFSIACIYISQSFKPSLKIYFTISETVTELF